jgi:poly-gamma-glutamate capsule biosynthesis protein CapA/YwtB (metallophosphatase superfamily)
VCESALSSRAEPGADQRSLSLALTGDVIPSFPLCDDDGRTLRSAPLRAIAAELRQADVAVANFELALTHIEGPREKMFTTRCDPALAPDVAQLGFDVLTVANNHTLDHGWAGLAEGLRHLRATGLELIGAGETLAAALTPAVRSVSGQSIGVLPFSCLLPVGAAAGGSAPNPHADRALSWLLLTSSGSRAGVIAIGAIRRRRVAPGCA